MEILEKKYNDVIVLELIGGCELNDSKKIMDIAKKEIKDGHKFIILNFSQLEYIDSISLGTLIGINKKLKKGGGELIIATSTENVKEIFDVTNTANFFTFVDTLEDAYKLTQK